MSGYPGAGGRQVRKEQGWWICSAGHVHGVRARRSHDYAGWVCERGSCDRTPKRITAKSVLAAIKLGGWEAGELLAAQLKQRYADSRRPR